MRYGWIGGEREKVRGEYRFSSLVKRKKKRKITLSFTSPEKDFFFIFYDVITWGKKKALLITTYIYIYMHACTFTSLYLALFLYLSRSFFPSSPTSPTLPSLPRTHTLSIPVVGWYLPA